MSIHSNFWCDFKSNDEIDHIQLASVRRSIANFVNILTCKNIPVRFYGDDRGDSFTDGETVTISADITMDNFDATVGTALHEGAHIVYSDFELLKQLSSMIPQQIFNIADKKNLNPRLVRECVKDCWNYVEDRFIDKTVFDSAPGYREYYRSMYRQLWHSDAITKVLASDAYRDESIESYMYRIINLTNPSTDLTALNGLLDIAKTIGFKDILRLQKPIERFQIAFRMVEIILDNVGSQKREKTPPKTKKDYTVIPGSKPQEGAADFPSKFKEVTGDTVPADSTDSDDDLLSDLFGNDDIFGGIDNQIEAADNSCERSKDSEDDAVIEGVGKRTLRRAKKDFEKQKNFLNGDVDKKPLSDEDNRLIKNIEESGVEYRPVGVEGHGVVSRTKCVVVKKMTRDIMETDTFPLTSSNPFSTLYSEDTPCRRAVNDGLRMGTVLGKRLKVRGESRSTKYTRQRSGKIDKRLISNLGYSFEKVFSHVEVDSYKNATIHISVDASYSMRGDKWNKTMTSVVAIAKAASMINNLEVTISFRTTNDDYPYIVKAYDSTEDSIVKIKSLFPALNANSLTPEGLAFEAIMDMIPASTDDCDSYFLNFSDGEPYYKGNGFRYAGEIAVRHTKKQVAKIRSKGVEVISYFISDTNTMLLSSFKSMYGNDAHDIDVTNVHSVALSMNKKFLNK